MSPSDDEAVLVLASHNAKKTRELRIMLATLGVRLSSLADFPGSTPPVESGATFEENALLKARHACSLTGLPSLADDSGLAVDVLGGEPGIRSARFAGEDADDAANNRKLLERMRGVPPERRAARFISVVALASPNGSDRVWRGETRGRILEEERGTNGFGYDPLFYSDDLGVAFAEAGDAEKNRVSHRGRALAAFMSDMEKGGIR